MTVSFRLGASRPGATSGPPPVKGWGRRFAPRAEPLPLTRWYTGGDGREANGITWAQAPTRGLDTSGRRARALEHKETITATSEEGLTTFTFTLTIA